MELSEVKSVWQSYDSKLEKTLKLNLHFLELIQSQKIKSKLAPVFWQRVVEITFHVMAIILLLGFLYNNLSQFPYAASALVLLAFYTIASLNCLKQISIIKGMDYSNDIVTIQSSLLMLQTNILNYARLAVLCIPTFLAYPAVVSKAIKDLDLRFFADFDIITQSNGSWWTAQLVSSIVLIPLCIWFYRQVTYKNVDKKWVKDFIQKSSGTRVRKAIESIKELESLKHGVI
ncbi:MAG: hypothetical protein ABI675_23620 [Chitinophagaceae bacterium]